jgi:hypothetical protein
MDGENLTNKLAQRHSRLPRFSLLTLLLFVVIAALTLTTVSLVREVRPLRAENNRLNEERGTLMIADRSKLQAIRIPDQIAGEGRESFRVYVPADSLYWVFLIVNEVPKSGYPTLESYPKPYSTLGGSTSPVFGRLEPGEHVLTIREDRRNAEHMRMQLIVDGLDVTANNSSDRWPTRTPETYTVFEEGVERVTTPADRSGRLVLQRRRIAETSPVNTNIHVSYVVTEREPEQALDGVMMWIERDPGRKSN